MSSKLPLISLVIPCYNEQENIKPFLSACEMSLPVDYNYELIFVNDASTDDTYNVIKSSKISRKDMSIVQLDLARNSGKEIAVTAGLHKANGEAVVIIDADLQHPPAVIPELIRKWEQGSEVVIGVRKEDRKYAAWYKRLGGKIFYKIINKISEVPIVPYATDFRLIDRMVVDEFNKFTERNRMNRGLIDWLGFERDYVHFTPASRIHGEPSYSLTKLTGLALNSIIGMSLIPLKLAGYLGVLITIIFGLLGFLVGVEMFLFKDPWHLNIANSINLAILIIFLIGLVLMALGLAGLYIAAIHTEVTNRPLYVLRTKQRRTQQN